MNENGMRVAIGYDAGFTTGGIGRYARDLVAGLYRHREISEVRPFVGLNLLPIDVALDAAALRSDGGDVGRHWLAGALRSVPGGVVLTRAIRDRKYSKFLHPGLADIYHEPNYALRQTDLATVVSVHDLGVFLYPECHPTDRVRYLSFEIPSALQRSDHIITLSSLVKRQIIEMFGIDADKISVVPIGVNPIFHQRKPQECSVLLAALGLSWQSYILFVGTLEPRKNLERVLTALRMLPPQLARSCPLVVVGAGGWRNEALKADLDDASRLGIVIQLGHITDDALAVLYAGARGVVFPSLYEGQGLPALEAAASGTPVLISRGSAMEEQMGGLAVMVEAVDERSILDGLSVMLTDDKMNETAAARAHDICLRFSMQACVNDTVNVYKSVLKARA